MSLLPVFDLKSDQGRSGFSAHLDRLQATVSGQGHSAQAVARIVQDVAQYGDEAVVGYMRQWADPDFEAQDMRIDAAELVAAESQLDPKLRQAILTSIEHVRAYQRHIMPTQVKPLRIDGAELGLRWSAVERVGLCVPGGTAALFSTLVMLAVPAQVAGVDSSNISIVSPPPTRCGQESAGQISSLVLATCQMLGITRVYRIGGAQAVAALAYGTETVSPVDLIAGPGNVYVQLAKAQVHGVVGTDSGFYGPSEIAVIADGSAEPRRVAADLLAQAEHDPGKCFLIAWDREVIDAVCRSMEEQVSHRHRRDAIKKALDTESCALLVADRSAAIDTANTIACEHLSLAVADPDDFAARIRHAGELFLGDETPVAAGDYYAGPSHCLPTGTTARFASGVSVYNFLKRSGTIAYPSGMSAETIGHIVRLAEAEGLDGHAASARARAEDSP